MPAKPASAKSASSKPAPSKSASAKAAKNEPEFLTEPYLEHLASEGAQVFGELPKNLSGVVALKISGGPGGETKGKTNATIKLTKGAIVSAAMGASKDAEVTLEASYDLARALFAGEADSVEQYMAGNLKASGDMTFWLSVLPAWQAASKAAARN